MSTKKEAKKEGILDFRPLEDISVDELEGRFILLRDELDAKGRKLEPHSVKRMCTNIGTHLLKMVSPKTRTGGGKSTVLRVNTGVPMYPSGDASLAGMATLICRPLHIKGDPHRGVVDHALYPNKLSENVCAAFARVFGADVLDALKEEINKPTEITEVPASNFPIVYVPSPLGGDLQVTPVASFHSTWVLHGIKWDNPDVKVRKVRWFSQNVSTNPQNVSPALSAIGGKRLLFLAEMPDILGQYDSEIYRYAHGDSFPHWRDIEVADEVRNYVKLLERDYSNQKIRAGLDRRADRLLAGARVFVEDVLMDVAKMFGESHDANKPPSLDMVILRRRWENSSERDAVRTALLSGHFKSRAKLVKI